MVTLQTADNALKSVYLGVVNDQLNIKANPLLNKIKQSTADVWGKEVIKLAPFGLNGGVGAGAEDGVLPQSFSNQYVQFKASLKNLYGKIELSDKSIRASQSNSGAFVNLLNAEMEGLIKASAFNLSRMLYSDGSGRLLKNFQHTAGENTLKNCDSIKAFMEGMTTEVVNTSTGATVENSVKRITKLDRENKSVTFASGFGSTALTPANHAVTMQNSFNKEISGLGRIFNNDNDLYGVDRNTHSWMKPYVKNNVGEISDVVIQEAIDYLDEVTGSDVDFITCSSDVKRAYQNYLSTFRRNIDYMDLAGGYKAMSFSGVPIISDRFVEDGTMYLLNTNEFVLHQLCDWEWLESDDGRILKQAPHSPTYMATLVKYAELICDKPNGQAKLSGIVSA